jgi:hydroxymethylbilane synthase
MRANTTGLQRLGFDARIRLRLDAPDWLPAPAQGAIAIECKSGEAALEDLFSVLDHRDTRIRVEAERAMNRALHGSCHVPVAAYATLSEDRLHLTGLVGSASEGRLVRAHYEGSAAEPEALGRTVAAALLEQGAGEFL